MIKIIIAGKMAKYPLGGVTWDWLNYLLGFRALGLDVYYYEEIPDWIFNKNRIKYLEKTLREFNFSKKWCVCITNQNNDLATSTTKSCFGMTKKNIYKLFASSDLILDIAGCITLPWINNINGKKAIIDSEPMIAQLNYIKDKSFWEKYDIFFTYGENIGKKGCAIPINKEIQWKITRFPVFLGAWPFQLNKNATQFTTICNWQRQQEFIYQGKKYNSAKSVEFLKFVKLPAITEQNIELATNISFKRNGWKIVNAMLISKNWKTYQQYIYDSKAEFSAAKNAYVKAQTGWFSGRSACYLAAGKPAVLQDTGFSKFIPTGRGLFAFSTVQEAANAVNEINKNYEYHCREARKIAEEYFDSKKILSKLLKDCGL